MSSLIHVGYQFKQFEPVGQPELYFSKVSLFKGVHVLRNNNYTTDSYNIIQGEEANLTEYALWQLENQKLAE